MTAGDKMICRRLPADIREKVCSRLRRGKSFTSSNWYAYPAGASFCADKRMQNGSGLRPENPVALLRWSAERRITTPVPSSEEGD